MNSVADKIEVLFVLHLCGLSVLSANAQSKHSIAPAIYSNSAIRCFVFRLAARCAPILRHIYCIPSIIQRGFASKHCEPIEKLFPP